MLQAKLSVPQLLITSVVLSAFVQAAFALEGRVIGVSDGDTISLLDASRTQHKIRLAGIDAPESGQAFGSRAKQTLSDCAFGKQAQIEGSKSDRYGRTVAKVIVNGTDCNLRQIELGMAWHYKKYESEQTKSDRILYATAQNAAMSQRKGLWIDAKPVAPWEWRNGEGVGTQRGDALIKESSGQCDCSAGGRCTGKRGGEYCLTPSGSKRYF